MHATDEENGNSLQSSQTSENPSNPDHASTDVQSISEEESAIDSHSQNELFGEKVLESREGVDDDAEEADDFEAAEENVLAEENIVTQRRNETDEPAKSPVKSVKLKFF